MKVEKKKGAKKEISIFRKPHDVPYESKADDLGNWERTHYSREISAADDGKTVIVMGWVRALRAIGKLKFIQLADREGYVQITARENEVPENLLAKIDSLGREYAIAVRGTVRTNKEAPNGFEVLPREIKIVAKAEPQLPLEVVTKKTPAELPTRLDARFLDLRKPEVAAIFDVADTLKISFLNYFDKNGFININPPIIVGAATEGGTELFPVKYFDREAFLNQSPQLYKQIVMASGFDKVSIVTPVFRAEPHDTYRHLNEMVQMDIEVAWVRGIEDALKWYDGVFKYSLEQVNERCKESLSMLGIKPSPVNNIKRLTYDEAVQILNSKGTKLEWGQDFSPEHEKKICEAHNPVIITHWPTKLRSFYSMPEPADPKICRAYDLIYNGLEISSGAQRIHQLDLLVKRMKEKNIDLSGFKFYMDAFRYGMPAHAGWSIGLERFTMALLKLSNIREATLFPRTKERLYP